jgi:hypothetical protein
MLEECSDHTKLEEAMAFSPLAMERLQSLPTFQAWERKVRAAGIEQGRAAGIEQGLGAALVSYFIAKGDAPTRDALAAIDSCADQALLRSWLLRAYGGETAAQIFTPVPAEAVAPASSE